jgi:hypothetical protein
MERGNAVNSYIHQYRLLFHSMNEYAILFETF